MSIPLRPVSALDLPALHRLEEQLRGARLLSVGYVPLPEDSGSRESWSSVAMHEVDLDVVLVLDVGRLTVRWARDNRMEGLALEFEERASAEVALPADCVLVDAYAAWKPLVGSAIASVASGWQRAEPSSPFSLWSVRLGLAGGDGVVIALGELDDDLRRPRYHPDTLVVLFDEMAAREYETSISFGSAWGAAGLSPP